MTEAQPISGTEPLAKGRRVLEINELRARDAEARLRFIVAELQIRELSEKLADVRRARTIKGLEGHGPGPEVSSATEAAIETVSAGSEPAEDGKDRDREKRPRVWKWPKAARKK